MESKRGWLAVLWDVASETVGIGEHMRGGEEVYVWKREEGGWMDRRCVSVVEWWRRNGASM